MNPITIVNAGAGADPRVDEIIQNVVTPFIGEPAVPGKYSVLTGAPFSGDPTAPYSIIVMSNRTDMIDGPQMDGRTLADIVAQLDTSLHAYGHAVDVSLDGDRIVITATVEGELNLAVAGQDALAFVGSSPEVVLGEAGVPSTGVAPRLEVVEGSQQALGDTLGDVMGTVQSLDEIAVADRIDVSGATVDPDAFASTLFAHGDDLILQLFNMTTGQPATLALSFWDFNEGPPDPPEGYLPVIFTSGQSTIREVAGQINAAVAALQPPGGRLRLTGDTWQLVLPELNAGQLTGTAVAAFGFGSIPDPVIQTVSRAEYDKRRNAEIEFLRLEVENLITMFGELSAIVNP